MDFEHLFFMDAFIMSLRFVVVVIVVVVVALVVSTHLRVFW